MSEFMITFDRVPPADFFEGAVDQASRIRLLRFFHAPVRSRLDRILSRFDVSVTELEAIGAMIVRGSQETLAMVRADDEFKHAGVTVSEDVRFVTLRST